jgi:hypothetical protein
MVFIGDKYCRSSDVRGLVLFDREILLGMRGVRSLVRVSLTSPRIQTVDALTQRAGASSSDYCITKHLQAANTSTVKTQQQQAS